MNENEAHFSFLPEFIRAYHSISFVIATTIFHNDNGLIAFYKPSQPDESFSSSIVCPSLFRFEILLRFGAFCRYSRCRWARVELATIIYISSHKWTPILIELANGEKFFKHPKRSRFFEAKMLFWKWCNLSTQNNSFFIRFQHGNCSRFHRPTAIIHRIELKQ